MTRRRTAARKAAATRRRNKRREVSQVIVGKHREFLLIHRRMRTGVSTTVKAAPGWMVTRRP
jgi:hypothetical protein